MKNINKFINDQTRKAAMDKFAKQFRAAEIIVMGKHHIHWISDPDRLEEALIKLKARKLEVNDKTPSWFVRFLDMQIFRTEDRLVGYSVYSGRDEQGRPYWIV